jgi:hypothetical protein
MTNKIEMLINDVIDLDKQIDSLETELSNVGETNAPETKTKLRHNIKDLGNRLFRKCELLKSISTIINSQK